MNHGHLPKVHVSTSYSGIFQFLSTLFIQSQILAGVQFIWLFVHENHSDTCQFYFGCGGDTSDQPEPRNICYNESRGVSSANHMKVSEIIGLYISMAHLWIVSSIVTCFKIVTLAVIWLRQLKWIAAMFSWFSGYSMTSPYRHIVSTHLPGFKQEDYRKIPETSRRIDASGSILTAQVSPGIDVTFIHVLTTIWALSGIS